MQKLDAPRQVTTPSLEAVQAYSLGLTQSTLGEWKASIPYFKHAIELDPNFTMAWYELGIDYLQLGNPQEALPCLKKAYDLSDRVSESEKLNIRTAYYFYVTHEPEKSIETAKLWAQTYPRQYLAHHMLGNRYNWAGDLEKRRRNTEKQSASNPGQRCPLGT
jgi:tetratricopeptide (TPR) repeat protein